MFYRNLQCTCIYRVSLTPKDKRCLDAEIAVNIAEVDVLSLILGGIVARKVSLFLCQLATCSTNANYKSSFTCVVGVILFY